jgi:hypothetical protein
MDQNLSRKRIAILVTDGFEQTEPKMIEEFTEGPHLQKSTLETAMVGA